MVDNDRYKRDFVVSTLKRMRGVRYELVEGGQGWRFAERRGEMLFNV